MWSRSTNVTDRRTDIRSQDRTLHYTESRGKNWEGAEGGKGKQTSERLRTSLSRLQCAVYGNIVAVMHINGTRLCVEWSGLEADLHRPIRSHQSIQHWLNFFSVILQLEVDDDLQQQNNEITGNALWSPAWLAHSCAVGATWRIWLNDQATCTLRRLSNSSREDGSNDCPVRIQQQHKKSAKVAISNSFCTVHIPT